MFSKFIWFPFIFLGFGLVSWLVLLQLEGGVTSTQSHFRRDLRDRLFYQQSLQPVGVVTPRWISFGWPEDDGDDQQRCGRVSLTTTVSQDRVGRLKDILRLWDGPVSVTLHHDATTAPLDAAMFDDILSSEVRSCVDIHLLSDTHPNQLNMWRNIARVHSRTPYTFMCDIDFLPSSRLFHFVDKLAREGFFHRSHKNRVLVVAAFEGQAIVTERKQLKKLWDDGKASMFHPHWVPGHNATDYARWWEARELYQIFPYESVYKREMHRNFYEPYLVIPPEAPFCDMRFVHRDLNKVACVYEIAQTGDEFWVLPSEFIYHKYHTPATNNPEHVKLIHSLWSERFLPDLRRRYQNFDES